MKSWSLRWGSTTTDSMLVDFGLTGEKDFKIYFFHKNFWKVATAWFWAIDQWATRDLDLQLMNSTPLVKDTKNASRIRSEIMTHNLTYHFGLTPTLAGWDIAYVDGWSLKRHFSFYLQYSLSEILTLIWKWP